MRSSGARDGAPRAEKFLHGQLLRDSAILLSVWSPGFPLHALLRLAHQACSFADNSAGAQFWIMVVSRFVTFVRTPLHRNLTSLFPIVSEVSHDGHLVGLLVDDIGWAVRRGDVCQCICQSCRRHKNG